MLNNQNKYDVVVIGGGPAGLVTASKCASSALNTLVLERDREIGVPVRCAEGIMLKALADCGDIPESIVASKIDKIKIIPPNKDEIVIPSKDKGLILHRELFDKFLAHKALMAGAEIRLKSDVIRAEYNKEEELFYIYVRNDLNPILARVLVAADGIDSKVGRWFNVSETLTLNDIDSCAQYLLFDKSLKDGECSFIFDTTYAPGGYVWIFPKGDDTANVGLGVNPIKAKKTAKEYLDDYIRDYFPNSQALRMTTGAVPVRKTNPVLVKDRLLLVGDAAFQTNAISGGGIDTAISAGELCGEIISQAVSKNDINDKKLYSYQTKWHAKHKNKESIEQIIKDKIVNASNNQLDRYFSYLRDISLEELNILNIFKTLIIKKPALFAKLSTKVFFDFLK